MDIMLKENENKLVLPLKYSIRIYYTSFISLISIITSLYFKLYDFTLLTSCVMITSLNYWKYPIRNWRRTLDIVVVSLTFIYKMYRSYYSNTRYIYYLFNLLGIGCYIIAKKSICKNRSSLYHCGIHIVSNI
jgi:hypothetical protein